MGLKLPKYIKAAYNACLVLPAPAQLHVALLLLHSLAATCSEQLRTMIPEVPSIILDRSSITIALVLDMWMDVVTNSSATVGGIQVCIATHGPRPHEAASAPQAQL